MGLDDRDYMRRRNRASVEHAWQEKDRRPPFTPPADQPSMLVMIGWWLGAAFLAYKAYGWWNENHQRAAPNRAGYQQPRIAAPRPIPQPAEQPRTADPLVAAMPAPHPVAVPAGPTPMVETPRPQTGGTVYLCRAYSGGSFWASDHCNRHNALVERMVSVPEGMPFQQQVQLAEQRRQALAEATSTVQTTTSNGPSPAVASKALCESLDARVNQLDAIARQPQSGTTQDWIRTERQKTRDEQFRLRC